MVRKPSTRRPRKADVKAAAERAEKRSKGEKIETPSTPIDPVIASAEEIKKIGRPTLYKPEYAAVAKALCRRGATDAELAEEFNVSIPTIWRWTVKYDEFCSALKVEKAAFDDRVERTLAQRAVGYTFPTEKIFNNNGNIIRVDTLEHVPPDVGAAKLWLTNRRRKDWADISRNEHTGADGGAIEVKTSVDEIHSRIARLAERDSAKGSTRRDH